MAVYMISYDIKVKDNFEYKPLYEAIKGISGYWCWPLESVWFVDTTRLDANDIMKRLRPFLTIRDKGGDTIIIRRCLKEGDGVYSKEAINWIIDDRRTWLIPPVV